MDTDRSTRIPKDANPVISEYAHFLPQFMIKAESDKAL